MLVNCYLCGHEMRMVEYKIYKMKDRYYVSRSYKCVFDGCPSQKGFGSGCILLETLYGVKENTEFIVDEDQRM